MDTFFTQTHCDRCGAPLTGGRTMSMFDTSCICMKCAKEERARYDYGKARDAEMDAVRNGNRNFAGIGF